jgi:pyruvate/2-oxoglutarate dehydrogenase complex dihydrolipoamide acyltransferase (E2) component
MHILRPSASLLTLAVLVVLAAGCGGSGTAAGSDSSSSSDARDAAQVKFRSCMRDNGVNLPDSPGQGGGAVRRDVDQATLQKAQKACGKYQRQAFGNISADQRQKFRDAFAKFASCMRQHGVDVPDPPADTGGRPAGVRSRLDESDPKVKAATTACSANLPKGGPGPRGGR